jgi:hypothetical protein
MTALPNQKLLRFSCRSLLKFIGQFEKLMSCMVNTDVMARLVGATVIRVIQSHRSLEPVQRKGNEECRKYVTGI